MSKALCTAAFGQHLELLGLGRPALERYAERHGYEIVVRGEPSTALPASWEKIQIVRELLDDHEAVMWIDADAIIVDSSRDIFSDLDPDRGFGIVMHVAGSNMLPNAGVLALRSAQPTFDLLDASWELRDKYANHAWWEQAAICDVLGFVTLESALLRLDKPSEHMLTTQFLGSEWNSIAAEQSVNPRIKHYASVPHEARVTAMTRDRDLLARSDAQPAYELAAVLMLGGSGEQATLQALEAVAELKQSPSVQVVLLVPAETRLDGLLSTLPSDVVVVRADGASDSVLLQGLAVVDARVVLVANAALMLNQELADWLHETIGPTGSVALRRTVGTLEIIAFSRDRVGATGWISDASTAGRQIFDPVLRALAQNGVEIVGRA